MAHTYILCPGQGAQHVGMGHGFAQLYPEAQGVYDRANQVLGYDLAALCFEGPEDRLNMTDVSQPAIYTTSVACYHAARAAGAVPTDGSVVYAGLSLGEYTALHLAGVFTFDQGLQLVGARGRFMQEAAVANPGGMVAIMGGDAQQVESLCDSAAQGEVLAPANYNAPGQIVASGTKAACDRLVAAAEAAGLKAVPLTVAGAFHSALMQPAADRMRAELDRVKFNPPRAPVMANVTAGEHGDPESIKRLLVDQIVRPVRWEQTMAPIANAAEAQFVELAPGKVLTGLLRKQNRRAEIKTFATADQLRKPL